MIKQIFNLKYGLPKCMQELLFTWFTDPLIIGRRFDVKKKKSSPNSFENIILFFTVTDMILYSYN